MLSTKTKVKTLLNKLNESSLPLTAATSAFMVPVSFLFSLLLLSSNAVSLTQAVSNQSISAPANSSLVQQQHGKPSLSWTHNRTNLGRSKKLESSTVLISGSSKIHSENRTFELGFFSSNGEADWYLGIWYASTPSPTYVWVANRETPIKNLSSSQLEIIKTGQLALKDAQNSIVWQTTNTEKVQNFRLLETGNLVLLSAQGSLIWQSFDHPTDTWLPGMNLSRFQSLTSWRSLSDPSPGLYSLRLNPLEFNEFELVYNNSVRYWSTGTWIGNAFAGVPEMTVPYIYKFHFADPFTPTASFWYTEVPLDSTLRVPLTRFHVDSNGQLRQYTWSAQAENWNMFWSRPERPCGVYNLCGNMGLCTGALVPCVCPSGFTASDGNGWKSKDYSSGCRRVTDDLCDGNDGFEEVGVVGLDSDRLVTVSFSGNRRACERTCLGNCSCIGLYHNGKANMCKNLYGPILNMRNLSPDSTNGDDVLYVRTPRVGNDKHDGSKTVALSVSIVGSVSIFGLAALMALILRKRKKKLKGMDDDGVFPVLNLKAFSYKELHAMTRGFSEKLGHGGFGTVFQGELPDSTIVAVKRLERPGSGEKEFRAEVCTIGNIQHVNLVRLRGFCSENSHRLLVYDYMPKGPLSVYLRRDGPNLGWDVRFRVAIGTARGIAYLHEECRDCIIHCDIKPENILLDSDYTAKVSDFGLAKLIGRDFSRVLATMRGTWGYVAPEWISGLAITTKADVYSYGMTLLELIGGRRNVEAPPPSAGKAYNCGEGGGGGHGEKWFFPPYAARQVIEGNVAAVVDDRLGGAYNTEEAARVAFVAIWCIQDEEEMRPTMGMVVKMLEGVVEVPVPRPPKLLQALVSGDSYHGVQVDSGNRLSSGCSGGGCSDNNTGPCSRGSSQSPSFLGDVYSPVNENNV